MEPNCLREVFSCIVDILKQPGIHPTLVFPSGFSIDAGHQIHKHLAGVLVDGHARHHRIVVLVQDVVDRHEAVVVRLRVEHVHGVREGFQHVLHDALVQSFFMAVLSVFRKIQSPGQLVPVHDHLQVVEAELLEDERCMG